MMMSAPTGPDSNAVIKIAALLGEISARDLILSIAASGEYEAPVVNVLARQLLHIHRSADFPDVYALLASRHYDAIFDVFLALPPVPTEFQAFRLLLACSHRLF